MENTLRAGREERRDAAARPTLRRTLPGVVVALLLVVAWTLPVEPTKTVLAQSNPPPPPEVTPQASILIATPHIGHSGDMFYLSGAHLHPSTQLSIMMACPNWFTAARQRLGNLKFGEVNTGPRTDAQGEFIRYPVRALTLQHLRRSGCHIYAESDNNAFGPDVPASYDIVPSGTHLAPCEVHLCAEVQASPRRAHTGSRERILIRSWPGAQVSLDISFPGSKASSHQAFTLGWQGGTVLHLKVPGHLTRTADDRARVRVHVHFAPTNATGIASGQFTIIR